MTALTDTIEALERAARLLRSPAPSPAAEPCAAGDHAWEVVPPTWRCAFCKEERPYAAPKPTEE